MEGRLLTIRRVFRQFVSYALTITETFVLLQEFPIYIETKDLDMKGKINFTTRFSLPAKQSEATTDLYSDHCLCIGNYINTCFQIASLFLRILYSFLNF